MGAALRTNTFAPGCKTPGLAGPHTPLELVTRTIRPSWNMRIPVWGSYRDTTPEASMGGCCGATLTEGAVVTTDGDGAGVTTTVDGALTLAACRLFTTCLTPETSLAR